MSANNFLWRGPSLLVPVTVEALVVTTRGQSMGWQYNANTYTEMKRYGSIEPLPFANTTSPPPTGVTLHWTLPDAISHGVEDAQGQIDYPPVPNRWLITRSHQDPQRPGVMLIKAWVVQSDFLDPRDGSSSFPDPGSTTRQVTKIGRAVVQEQWSGEVRPDSGFVLKAIGPGDATFAANVVNIKNVFAFEDPLQGFEGGPQTNFNYVVMGWYSNHRHDPLYGRDGKPWTTKAEWLQIMESLNWSVGSGDDLDNALAQAKAWYQVHDPDYPWTDDANKYPARTVCHGMVYKVRWEGRQGPAQSGVPSGDTPRPRVAIGNTAIDALAAMVQHFDKPTEDCQGRSEIAELLEAFQYDLLSTFSSSDRSEALSQAILNAWFGSVPGGTLWQVVEPDQLMPHLSAEQAEMLARLNSAQRDLDALRRKLSDMQWELYALWWKVGLFSNIPKPPKEITLAKLKELFENAKPAVDTMLNRTIPQSQQTTDELEEALKTSLPERLTLVKSTAPRFQTANEPVVMIYGAHRSYKYGEGGRFRDDETLFTRFTGQFINALEVKAEDKTKLLLRASDLNWSPALPNPQWIPKEVSGLLLESFFLDTSNASFIAATAGRLSGKTFDVERIKKQQTIIWNPDLHSSLDRQSIAEISGLKGTIPSKVSVDLWRPPWSPLYLDWHVTWHPSARLPTDALTKWKFDGLEYKWNSGSPDALISISFKGRTLLTPKAPDDFGYRLQQFISDYEKGRLGRNPLLDDLIPKLKDLLERAVKWDLLSQSMSGFNNYLVMRNPTIHIKPDTSITGLTGQSLETTPIPAQNSSTLEAASAGEITEEIIDWVQVISTGDGGTLMSDADPFVPFFPIRSGHFELLQLWVVDDFGQVFNVTKDPGIATPIRAEGMCTNGNRKLLQLPPRLSQPSRLMFEQVSAEKDDRDTSIDPLANPVCGWLLPNHLDRGLTIYDTGGGMLGSLSLVGNPGSLRLRWNPAPGSNDPVGSPPRISNRHLRGFIVSILGLPKAADAFQDFLDVIDSTLWTINPWESVNDQNVSLLIGRPLAMVRARLEYQFFGQPVYDQSWGTTGKQVTLGYEQVDFPVKLGNLQMSNDGLLGYFLESDYQRFNAVHAPQSARSNYIAQENVKINFGPRKQTFVSMVMDPRGVAHATNGIMPVRQIQLAPAYVNDPLEKMEVTFRTGPLMTDPAIIRMPTPADIRGRWSWIQRSGVILWQDPAEIVNTGQQARLDDAPAEFVDGWLKLSDAFGNRTGSIEKKK